MSIVIKDEKEYDKLKNRGLVIVDFNTEWCVPCKKFAPIFDEIAKNNPETTFLSVDAEKIEHNDASDIRSVPTFKVFLNGKLRREFSGCNRNKLEEYIQRYQIQISFNGKPVKSFTAEDKEKVMEYMNKYSV